MALLRKGCFCCELRTCVLVQAWTSMLIAVLHTAFGLLVLALMADLVPHEHLPEEVRVRLRPPAVMSGNRKAAAAAVREMKVQQALVGSMALMMGLINLSITIALVLGCRKENRRLLVPALIWGAAGLVFITVMTIVTLVATPAKVAALVAVSGVPLLVLSVYFWLHILSYYLELREEDRELKRQTL
ncbi:uncharacterized protein LOC117649272 [Thrips palmi]|uniref:Uncharacterized protein LOC117649272 n=1 Tax=Thrips palmi TaxID=161013 RepID=A0A6P8ZDP6_THRPL|nr:uncharacterized protein LOC117649272 [Thrips palmi]XP_034247767.1 uncharacterized protein LOC117649272 [Thrips palmi]